MSKYTTEVRFICENKSGLDSSKGCNDVDDIISKCWDKIFTKKAPFFDEEYRAILCQKILKHYYLREICCETVGIWILWLNTRLEEIMPFYNQMYESAKLTFNPFNDVDLTRTQNRTANEKTTSDKSESGKNSNDISQNDINNITSANNENGKNLYSDTPQGSISKLENESYLTNATITTNNTSSNVNTTNTRTQNNESNYTNDEKSNGLVDTVEEYIEKIIGKQGTTDYSTLLTKFRNTFLNIDLQVIEEFEDLFFMLW